MIFGLGNLRVPTIRDPHLFRFHNPSSMILGHDGRLIRTHNVLLTLGVVVSGHHDRVDFAAWLDLPFLCEF